MFPTQALHIRAFRNLWLGQAISQFGDAFYYVVFLFMVKKVTGSTAMVGYVGALETLPYLLFSPYAGVLADRMDRRRIMLLSDTISGLILAVFVATLVAVGSPPVWMILFSAFALSTVRCFFLPAKSAAIPAIVPQDLLMKANALSMMTQNFMPLIALSLSASVLSVLYATSSKWFFTTAMAVNALSFFASAWFIMKLPAIVPDRKDLHESHPLADFREGLRFIRRRRDLKTLIAVLTMFRLMVAPFFVVYIAANELWFGGKPQSIAWFEFSFFLGMIVGSAVAGRFKIRRAGLAFSVGLAIVGVTIAGMAFSPWFLAFCIWNVAAGLAIPFADLPINTYMQLTIPDEFRGRVNSVVSMTATGAMPIGMVLGGLVVAKVGVVAAFFAMGVGMFVASLLGLVEREFRTATIPETALAQTAEPVEMACSVG